jgi:hypothetical protein
MMNFFKRIQEKRIERNNNLRTVAERFRKKDKFFLKDEESLTRFFIQTKDEFPKLEKEMIYYIVCYPYPFSEKNRILPAFKKAFHNENFKPDEKWRIKYSYITKIIKLKVLPKRVSVE